MTPGRAFFFALAIACALPQVGSSACVAGMDLIITKQQIPANPVAGGPVTYQLVVTNTGAATVTDLTVVDTTSPVVVGATTSQPTGIPPPAIASVPSGTRFVWSMQAATIQLVGVSAAATTATNPTSLTIPAPPGVASGQVLLTFLACNPVTSPNLLAGWTALVGTGNLRVYYRVAAGEPANYTWTCPSGKFAGAVLAYSGVDTVNPVDALAGQITSGLLHIAPGVTTDMANTMLVGGFMEWINNASWLPDPLMVERADIVTAGGGAANTHASLEVADQAWPLAGPTLDRTATALSLSSGVAYLVALRRASYLYPGRSLTFTITGQVGSVTVDMTVTNTAQITAADNCAGVTRASNTVSFNLTGAAFTLSVNPGSAGAFAVLSSTFIRNGGVTMLTGDLGYAVLGGSGSHTVSGATYIPSPAQAGADQAAALAFLNAQACTFTFTAGAIDLAADTTHGPARVFTPGVYCIDGAMTIGGGRTITLNGAGTYVFRSTGAFDSTATSQVVLTAGATADNVFWAPAGAATLGANSIFEGTVIDNAGITVGASTVWTGRALAFGGTVTFDTTSVLLPVAILSARLNAAPATISVGQGVQIVLTVTNAGSLDATNVLARAWDPGGMMLAGPTPSSTAWQTLSPGQVVTFSWTATPAAAGVFVYTATATGGAFTSSPSASATVTVQTPPALAAAVAVLGAPPCPGGLLLVRVTVTNTGEATAVLVGPVTPLASGSGSASYVAGPMPSTATLAAGEAISFTYTFTAGAAGAVVLATTVTGTDANSGFPVTSGPVASAAWSILSPAVLTLSALKTQTPASPAPGSPLTYTIVVTNSGSATVTQMTVVDTVSPAVTLVATMQPPAFGSPAISQGVGGTIYVWSAAVVMAPGASYSFTLTGTTGEVPVPLAVGNTAFVSAASDCSATILTSNPVSFVLGGATLQITVTTATSYDFGQVNGGSVALSATTFDIMNSGTVIQTVSFSVSNTAGGWVPVSTGLPGFNEFELDAQFNYPGPPAAWTAVDHALPGYPSGPEPSTGTRFAGNEHGMSTGLGLTRHLWVRLLAPSTTNQTLRQRMVITVTAQTP